MGIRSHGPRSSIGRRDYCGWVASRSRIGHRNFLAEHQGRPGCMEGVIVMKTCPMCGAVLTGAGDARPVGRPPRHSALDLQDCLGSHELTSGEFFERANATLDMSRTTFYRLLDRGRREFLFRQRLADGKWIPIVWKS